MEYSKRVGSRECFSIEIFTGSKFSYTVELTKLDLGSCQQNETRLAAKVYNSKDMIPFVSLFAFSAGARYFLSC